MSPQEPKPMGKGDTPRPVNRKRFEAEHERIFGRALNRARQGPKLLWRVVNGQIVGKAKGKDWPPR